MKAKILLTALVALSLFGSTNSFAEHPQGCRALFPDQFGEGCPQPPTDDREQMELSGCAYTAYADVTAPIVGNVVVPNVTPVNFTDYSGAPASPALTAPCPIWEPELKATDEFLGFSTPAGSPVGLSASVLRSTVDAEAGWFPSGGYSLSSATTASVSLSVPLANLSITADVVRAVAYCTKAARGPGRDDVGPAGFGAATLSGLTIAHPSLSGGQITINALPAEDTWIPIPGVGGIMLRETWDLEMPPAPGNPYKSFTENMIHVYLTGVVTGDIVISQAHCDGWALQGQPQEHPNKG